jgi:hypothetical protein
MHMTFTFILLFTMLEPEQQVEQQLEAIRLQMQQMRQQLGQVLERLDGPQSAKPECLAELRWVSGNDPRSVAADGGVAQLNLFSTISKPVSGCLPAEIRVTASYLAAGGDLICTGAIENVATQDQLAQPINLDVRPWDLEQFVRWRNEPPQINTGAKRLVCVNPEGVAEARAEELREVSSVRVRATVLPAGGGLSTAEIQINLQR